LDYYIHPQAFLESKSVGKGTRIWAFAHVLPTIGNPARVVRRLEEE